MDTRPVDVDTHVIYYLCKFRHCPGSGGRQITPTLYSFMP
jgi:hypothetical protein